MFMKACDDMQKMEGEHNLGTEKSAKKTMTKEDKIKSRSKSYLTSLIHSITLIILHHGEYHSLIDDQEPRLEES